MADQRLLDALAASVGEPPSDRFTAADLRGAQLADARVTQVSFRLANFEGADLSGVHFSQVDLEGARLAGADLRGASFHLVNAAHASFAGATCQNVFWEQTALDHSDLSSADLHGGMIRGCTLERANFDDADLTDARLIYCNANHARFHGACLDSINTVGTSFVDADFTGARKFFLSRQILVEILQRHVGDDFERAKLVGAIAIGSQWCYGEWRELLRSQPEYHDLVLQIFRRYPKSGFAEALRSGWRPETPEIDERGTID